MKHSIIKLKQYTSNSNDEVVEYQLYDGKGEGEGALQPVVRVPRGLQGEANKIWK